MERCPNCRARWDGGEQCRRCGMVLGRLLAAERGARQLVDRALACLAIGDAERAARSLRRAQFLRREPFTEILLGFARTWAKRGKLGKIGVRVIGKLGSE